MNLPKTGFCCMLWLCLLWVGQFCCAQTLSLDSVAKIEFVDRGYILSRRYNKLEITPENGVWKCYQTELRDDSWDGKKDNLNRVFLKDVPTKELSTLVAIITTVDTGLHINQFNINLHNLAHYIDSLYPGLKLKQKQEFIKAARSKEEVGKAAYRALRYPQLMDDLSHYFIVITARSGCTVTAHARSYYMYGFPWDIDGARSYNPSIAIAFHNMFGSVDYNLTEAKRLEVETVKEMYTNGLQTRFSFDDLKTEHPTAYKILGKTLMPVNLRLNSYGNGWGTFRSTLLPVNTQLMIAVSAYDTLLLNRAKRFEDTVVRAFKINNFLFEYLRSRPDSKMSFAPDQSLQRKKEAYDFVKLVYPGIVNYNYRQIQQIEVNGAVDVESKWLLLPDNTLILYQFKGIAQPDKTHIKLLNISPAIADRAYGKYQYNACIVFDSSGKVLHDYGLPKGYLY